MSNQPGTGFEDFGRKIDKTLNKAVPRAEEELKKAGVDVDQLAATLQDEGAKSFVASWKELMAVIETKSAAIKKKAS